MENLLIDTLARIHTFASTESPSLQGVQFRPIIRRHVTHVSPENIKVEVTFWVRKHENELLASQDGATTVVTVTLPKANEMAEKYRAKGWYEATWG